MIKIDLRQFLRDRMWFGWFYREPLLTTSGKVFNKFHGRWEYSLLWRDRLYPCFYHVDSYLPKWWCRLIDMFED